MANRQNQKATEIREWLLQKLSAGNPPKCALCDYSDVRALEIDHIHGGGYEARKDKNRVRYWKKIRLQYLRSLVKKVPEFRLLCRNCNWTSHLERKESVTISIVAPPPSS